MVQLLWKTVWQFHFQIITQEKLEHRSTKTCARIFTVFLCRPVPMWKQPKYSLTEEWMNKLYILRIAYCLAIKEKVTCIMDGYQKHGIQYLP